MQSELQCESHGQHCYVVWIGKNVVWKISVLTCVRNLKIIYLPVGDKNKSFDIPKSATRFTLRGQ